MPKGWWRQLRAWRSAAVRLVEFDYYEFAAEYRFFHGRGMRQEDCWKWGQATKKGMVVFHFPFGWWWALFLLSPGKEFLGSGSRTGPSCKKLGGHLMRMFILGGTNTPIGSFTKFYTPFGRRS